MITKLRCPILVINGDNDIQVSVNEAELLHAANKASKLLIIPKMNHILKDAPKDRQKNVATYFKPDLPLNKTLVKEIMMFIKN